MCLRAEQVNKQDKTQKQDGEAQKKKRRMSNRKTSKTAAKTNKIRRKRKRATSNSKKARAVIPNSVLQTERLRAANNKSKHRKRHNKTSRNALKN
ncbi:MAG: hypothetical protein L6V83_07430 [Christensenella sp.]|nr:MAG: hypothetical protein L6V83_07430 [Christensenella sp.]